jgi:hypothetical protein
MSGTEFKSSFNRIIPLVHSKLPSTTQNEPSKVIQRDERKEKAREIKEKKKQERQQKKWKAVIFPKEEKKEEKKIIADKERKLVIYTWGIVCGKNFRIYMEVNIILVCAEFQITNVRAALIFAATLVLMKMFRKW